MTDKDKIKRLQYILSEPLAWYAANKEEGADYLYDRSCEQFDNLPRGVAQEILQILSSDK